MALNGGRGSKRTRYERDRSGSRIINKISVRGIADEAAAQPFAPTVPASGRGFARPWKHGAGIVSNII